MEWVHAGSSRHYRRGSVEVTMGRHGWFAVRLGGGHRPIETTKSSRGDPDVSHGLSGVAGAPLSAVVQRAVEAPLVLRLYGEYGTSVVV